jgi:dUTP pyrophosphatase
MNIKVKKLHPDAVIPQYMTPGAAGFDLYAVEDCIIAPGESVKLPLGLSFEVPEGYVLYICMRSGISLKTSLRQSNGIGVIDSDYRGEVSMLFDNISAIGQSIPLDISGITLFAINKEFEHYHYPEGMYSIKKGDRICQGIIAPVIQATFIPSEELTETERGSGGFGHTGV